jgi:thiamine biosynthesis lipoprotein
MARPNRRREFNISLITILLILTALGCTDSEVPRSVKNDQPTNSGISVYGQTQGTTYAIMCNDRIRFTKREIDSVLHGFDLALSTYIPNSIISQFNNASAGAFYYTDSDGYFNECVKLSQSVYESTNGAFDPSVFTLLEMWGFLKDVENIPDSIDIRNALKYTGFKKDYHFIFKPSQIDSLPSKITKRTPEFKMVFNAIAQGQAVDVLCAYLEKKGAKNYFVEIGGEVRVRGVNDQENIWTIGIDKPVANSNANNRELINIIALDGKAVATSGNYRQFYEKNGVKYAHTLNPKNGYPVNHSLLSTTVVHESCALADAYATAFMVMGYEQTKKFVETNSDLGLDVFLIYNDEAGALVTYASDGFKAIIKS